MQASGMDRLIGLQSRSLARNQFGEEVPTYTTYATVWANVETTTGRLYFGGDQFQAERSTQFTIRYRDDVVLTDRINFEGQNYIIAEVSEITRRQGLRILASAQVP